ncbi:twin-arginine translocase TatA/TatE family subunit [Candidatus Thioglobus sp.]|nr:twin-arginine translocase TatA/TatE family subunit [Candidatus Thioglobus sp.]
MGNFLGWELILVLAIVLIVFGGKRIKNIGSDLGGAIKGFKSSMKDTDGEKKEDIIEAKVEADDESSDKKS